MKELITLNHWLEYIDSIHSKKIDLSLERIRTVAKRLKLLPFSIFSIIVAGTNGKGSTTTLLAKTLTNAGYKVGSTLSPHLYRFNERININLNAVDDKSIIEAFEAIESARSNITLSYFEFNTLASLYIFSKEKIDIAVLEVGLGGRFDAVNIVDADVAIITNIAMDHMGFLGNDRESIGEAKAGIIRKNNPIVYGDTDIPDSVIHEVKINNALLYRYGIDFFLEEKNKEITVTTKNNSNQRRFFKPNIVKSNLACALQTLDIIHEHFPVAEDCIIDAVNHFRMDGRWEIVNNPVKQIFDVAHNPDSINKLKELIETKPVQGKTLAVFSMLKTKDIKSSILQICSVVDKWYIAPLQHEKSVVKDEFEEVFEALNFQNYKLFSTITEGYKTALKEAKKDDRIIIFGSFNTIIEIKLSIKSELLGCTHLLTNGIIQV